MADITMCDFSDCPKSNQCYRFLAKPSKYQSYALFKNICNKENNYHCFWPIQIQRKVDDHNE